MSWFNRFVSVFFWKILISSPLWAGSTADITCDHAAKQAASEFKIPLEVFGIVRHIGQASKTTEQIQIWPWTVSIKGQRIWFDTEIQAQAYIFKHFRQGERAFDIGCFQLSFEQHSSHFNAIEDMFDPFENAQVFAKSLIALRNKHGNWIYALAVFHSSKSRHKQKYVSRYANMRPSRPEITTVSPVTDFERFPPVFGVTEANPRIGNHFDQMVAYWQGE
ncbi:MAG: hypothetical protein ABJL67_19030 [Sulfitobacter sp.]